VHGVRRAHAQKHATLVDAGGQVPFAIVGFDSHRSDLHAGVVDEHVDWAVRLLNAGHHGFPAGAAGDVVVVVGDVSPVRLQLLGQGSSEVVEYVGHRDDRTFARQGTNVCGAAQGYLASCAFLDAMVDDLGKSGRRTDKARFLPNILSSAAAPTSTLAASSPRPC
jgi:hypothetical protein